MHLVYPPAPPPPSPKKQLFITIVSDFSWDDCNTQENWKQWLSKRLGSKIYKNKVHYSLCESMNKLNGVMSFVMENKVANGA